MATQGTAASLHCYPVVIPGFVPGKENSKPQPLWHGSIFPEHSLYPTEPCFRLMSFLCAAETSLRHSACELIAPLCPKSAQTTADTSEKLTELLADTFAWLTVHGEEVKREWLEMTPERQRDSAQTPAAKQSCSDSDKGIINMKGI